MNIRFLIACLALGLLAAGGCAPGPKVHTDFDPFAEFSTFRTYAFSGITDRGEEIGPSDNSPLRMRIKEMVDEQLAAKGVRQVSFEDRPDLLVHLFFGVMDEQRVQNTGRTPGFYSRHVKTYEYHDGAWTLAKGVTTYEDHEGTLIVDLAASSKKELVWRAVISAVMGDNLEKNFEMANKGVAKAFKDYPPAK
jgi:glycosylphosphatidylinositol transamidase (GPIT) subunit GPI8